VKGGLQQADAGDDAALVETIASSDPAVHFSHDALKIPMTEEHAQEAGGGFRRGKLQFEVVLAIDGSERCKTDWTANRRIRGRCGANTSADA